MDDKTQKERLEQELKFLKESFEAEVISKEEFEKGKGRIEKKLKEIKKAEQPAEKPKAEEAQEEQIEKKEQKIEAAQETKSEENIKSNDINENKYFEDAKTENEEAGKARESAQEHPVQKEGKFIKYSIVFVVLVLIVFFSYSLLKGSMLKPQDKSSQLKFVAACNSNDDCRQEGKEGNCLNAATKNAKCEFREIQKTNVIVLNDRQNCFNCDTQRVLSILENWFGAINAKEIDYNTNEGKNISERFDAKILPMYILYENITKKPSFEQFKQVFAKKNGNYILDGDAAGSTFYFKREKISNKLDLFVISNDDASIKAENNLKEFLDNFKDVKFEKHLSTDKLSQELAIKAYPTFLISNVDKFNGVHSAETIKENFCKINKLKECEKSLSKSLV